jgi:hypothetical protein
MMILDDPNSDDNMGEEEEFDFLRTLEENDDQLFSMVSTDSPINRDYITIPVTIQGVKVLAAIESMTTISFVSPALAKELNCNIEVAKGVLFIFGKEGSRISPPWYYFPCGSPIR